GSAHLRDLPSFPTRRSSDLRPGYWAAARRLPLLTWAGTDPGPCRALGRMPDNLESAGRGPWPGPARRPDVPPRVGRAARVRPSRSEEHTSELQSQSNLVCRL